jgi:hypothetical protein
LLSDPERARRNSALSASDAGDAIIAIAAFFAQMAYPNDASVPTDD